MYELDAERLTLFRQRVLEEKTGARLAHLLEAARLRGQTLTSIGALKRAPAGLPKDHPRVEILRQKGLALSFGKIPRSARHSPALKEWLLEQAEIAAPTVRWAFEQKLG